MKDNIFDGNSISCPVPSGIPIGEAMKNDQVGGGLFKNEAKIMFCCYTGFVSALALVSIAILSFVLFCPIWKEWTNPEKSIQVHIEPPVLYIIPADTVPKWPNEMPNTVPPSITPHPSDLPAE